VLPHGARLKQGGSEGRVLSEDRVRGQARPSSSIDLPVLRLVVLAHSLSPRDYSRCHVKHRADETDLASGNHPVENWTALADHLHC
jgi:hypothetical protein